MDWAAEIKIKFIISTRPPNIAFTIKPRATPREKNREQRQQAVPTTLSPRLNTWLAMRTQTAKVLFKCMDYGALWLSCLKYLSSKWYKPSTFD